jgi:hypothetical protein
MTKEGIEALESGMTGGRGEDGDGGQFATSHCSSDRHCPTQRRSQSQDLLTKTARRRRRRTKKEDMLVEIWILKRRLVYDIS